NPLALVFCANGSFLLKVLDSSPGIYTHLTTESVLRGALSLWPEGIRKFDLCLIELFHSESATITALLQAAVPRLHKDSRIMLLWHNRLNVPVRCSVVELAKVIVALKLDDFDFDYAHSWASTKAAQLFHFVTFSSHSWPRWLRYPLSIIALVTGGALAIVDRLLNWLILTKPSPYLRQNCSSITVTANLSGRLLATATADREFMFVESINESAFTHQSGDAELFSNPNPRFTKWITDIDALKDPFVVIDVGVYGGESARWDYFGEHLVLHGFDPNKEAIDELRTAKAHLMNRTYHSIAIGNENGEKAFFFDRAEPTKSSFFEKMGVDVEHWTVP